MNFIVGDRVVMSQSGKERFHDEKWNPHAIIGTVSMVWDRNGALYPLHVTWDNKVINVYFPSDLATVVAGKELKDYL